MNYRRKIIKIKAVDSPNVRRALECIARGIEPDGRVLVPGVLTWERYQQHRAEWDAVRQCAGLDAEFFEGAELLLFPPEWLNNAERVAERLKGKKRSAAAIGVDPAEGGDETAMAVVDDLGVLEILSRKTPDTNVIVGDVLALMRRWGVPAERVTFDAGGGKQHVDRMRDQGFRVQAVAFGASVSPDPKRGMTPFDARLDERLERQAYVNRRAEMYGMLRERLDPSNPPGFGIPAEHKELRRQLSLMPLLHDNEGRLRMLSKTKRGKGGERTLTELLGRSPDHADALVLAVWGMSRKVSQATAGVF